MRRVYILLGLLLNLAMASLLFGQRTDRGIITGVVTDPAGAAVPQAKVTIIDEDTGVQTVVSTTEAGNYGTPPLVLGKYTVRVEKEGFKSFVRAGILLVGGITYRQDASLELGAVTQTIEVKAASEMITVTAAEVGHTVDQRYYQDLPVVMGADIRLAESLLHAQPGFQPMTPNGDAMFRGSQFHSRINGGQTMATENWMDGAAFGYAFGHQQTQESAAPYEAIREVKVINSSFSAQYGHTSGAFIEYVSKSGTNDWHGSVYEYLGNSALNARRFFEYDRKDAAGNPRPGTARAPSKNNDYGFTVGGPIWKDKTHFFTNLALFDLRQVVTSGFVWTVPTAQLRTGDFSPVFDPTKQIATDVLGRAIYDGQIFDPSTTRQVTAGQVDPLTGLTAVGSGPVREPFPGNIIPAGHPLRSQVGANWLALVPKPDREGLSLNTYGGFGDPNAVMDIWTWLLRIDHQITPNLKMSSSYWMNERPTIRKCGSPGLCDVPTDPRIDSSKNDKYISDGFVQRIANRNMHQQFDWVIKPTVFNHTTISYDRWYMGGWSISDGVGWHKKLGITGLPALNGTGGPPNIAFSGGIYGYTGMGTNWQRGFQAVNRWQFADDLTWISGRHTIKAGFEFRWHEFNLAGWARGIAGNWSFNRLNTGGYDSSGNTLSRTGDPLASLILGQVYSASFPITVEPSFAERYWSPWINDEIKVTDKLTINFGLRFDYQTARTERHNKYSTFDPTLPNPGAGGIPGAIAFATASQRTFEDPPRDAWGPRFGFAYRLSDKDVIRGGYGIYYSGVMFDMWITFPSIGYETNPTAPNLTNGLYPAGCVGSGASSDTCYGWWDDPFPQGRITFPPNITPQVANGTSPLGVARDGLTLPRYQNWSLTWQRQLTPNLLFDISYVANHGTRLINARSAADYSIRNANHPDVLAYGSALLQKTDFNDPAVVAAGITKPYDTFTGNVAQALRPFPQYQVINWRNLNNGNSIYHSLQAKLDKRFANGIQFRLAYVWSKLIVGGLGESGNAADAGCGSNNNTCAGRQNPINIAAERSVATDDVPHALILAYTYQLPFGRGRKFGSNVAPILDKFIGGWGVGGLQRYDAGRPISITMSNDMGGLLFNDGKRPNKLGGGSWGGGDFDPATSRYLDKSGWADPGALTFGNAPRTDPHVRYFALYSEDVNLIKDTYFRGERYRVRFEAQFGNLPNRVFYCNPVSNWSAGNFGQVSSQCNIPRRIQFGLRFDF